MKRKAGFKATDKKGVVATAGQALRAAVAAISQLSVTVSHGLASTYKTLAGTVVSSSGARTTGGAAGHGSVPGSTLNSSLPHDHHGRWQVWTAGSHLGATHPQAHTLNIIEESDDGSVGCSSSFGAASGSCNNNNPAQYDSSATQASSSRSCSVAAASSTRAAAASAPLRPSSAASQAPRSGAGLPLGEGLEHGQQQHITTSELPQASKLSEQKTPPSSKASQPAVLPLQKQQAAEQHVSSDSALDSSLTRNTSSCCSGVDCSWLRSNLVSIGWKLDPWIILLALATSCGALAAGAVQLAVRSRSQEQQNALKQVCPNRSKR